MTLSRMVPRAALGALTLGAVLTLAAPLLPFDRTAQAGEEKKEETTITISTSKDKEATVLKLEPMKPGETKTVTSESGKPVTVTRTEDGYTIKTGDREIKVKTSMGDDGPHVLLPGGKEVHVVKGHDCDDVNMVVTGDDEKKVVVRKHAYAYRIGDDGPEGDRGRRPEEGRAEEPREPRPQDPRRRRAGPPGDARQGRRLRARRDADGRGTRRTAEPGDGERVKVMVIQEKKDDGAKK